MEFTFETVYNQKALTTMARGLRKTVRKKKNRRSHILGWFVVVLAILLSISGDEGFGVSARAVVTWLVTAIIVVTLIWEDAINAYAARKRMLPGTERASSVFREEGYETTTDVGKTEWKYDKIQRLAETKEYFVFIFNQNHAQVYDKNSISGGTVEEFGAFIEKVTDKHIEKIR
ncbi:MAG: YcxB family protein [Lachnospiraceae bacterium]|nr:YcxB family protein [Lachnospiraceae bacterium]